MGLKVCVCEFVCDLIWDTGLMGVSHRETRGEGGKDRMRYRRSGSGRGRERWSRADSEGV